MKQEKARPLRWRLMVPLAVTFALLWLGVVAMLFSGSQREAKSQAALAAREIQDSLEEWWQLYKLDREAGKEGAGSILRQRLSGGGTGTILTSDMDGGMALLARDEDTGEVFRSQLAWGFGNEDWIDMDQRWYLTFDQGLDGAGQLALGRWLTEHANGNGYILYPKGEMYGTGETADGTYARVTGLQEPGHTLAVQRIQLIHPDGTAELIVETSTQGENSITLELEYIELRSVLMPGMSYHSDGTRTIDHTDMERRLDNYLEAQAILEGVLTGERQPIRGDGFALGMYDPDNRYVAAQYQAAPYVLRTNWGTYLALLVITAVAALILSTRLSKKVTRPAEELCRQTEEGRCREDGPVKELNALAVSFNAARDQLAGQLERERDFTRAAAHELKTPLAVLRAHGEALREDIDAQKREQYLDVILDECDRMSALVGSLLELSRLEAGAGLRREEVELSGLVRAVWAPLALPLERKGVSLTLELEEVRLAGDRERLREAAGNLASNALRHCTPGGAIRVTLKREGDRAVLAVYNDGEPIPAADLPHLFQPFYRGDKSRSRDSGGTGLGLAIVQAAVRAHGGECGAENTGSGVTFWLFLPLDG